MRSLNQSSDIEAAVYKAVVSTTKSLAGITVCDKDGILIGVNERFCENTGFTRDELVGTRYSMPVRTPGMSDRAAQLWDILSRGSVWQGDLTYITKSGAPFESSVTLVPITDEVGAIRSFVGFHGFKGNYTAPGDLDQRAIIALDPLTGYPTRTGMMRLMPQLLESVPLNEYSGFVSVSINELPQVNDAFGFAVGDKLLSETANMVRVFDFEETVRIGRVGSETFGFLFPHLGSDVNDAKRRLRNFIHRISYALSGEIDLGGGVGVDITTNAGFVVITGVPGDADDVLVSADPHEIVQSAEIARKRSLGGGQASGVGQFRTQMLTEAQDRVKLVSELRHGVEEEQLRLFLQPIVNADGNIVGEESLVRWEHPARGLLGPDKFLPLAEQSGGIIDVGAWMLKRACETIHRLDRSANTRGLTIAVNLSARELRNPDLLQLVRETMDRFEIGPGRLKLELTESTLHTNIGRAIRTLHELRDLGVEISLDDFGTGYSSLSYLRELPVQQLKIDRSFVQYVDSNFESTAVAKAIVDLGRTLSLQIVAEGIETGEQFDRLRDLGVDRFQGYLFSKPRSVRDAYGLTDLGAMV